MPILEKVAKALYQQIPLFTASAPIITWDELVDYKKAEYFKAAHAAISAMREPTDKMVDAGVKSGSGYGKQPDTWEAMIDVALSEK